MSHSALNGVVDPFISKNAVDEARRKAVAAADAIVNLNVALGNVDDLVLIKSDGSPRVACGCVRRSQRTGDKFEVWINGTRTPIDFGRLERNDGSLLKHLYDTRRESCHRGTRGR